MAMEPWEWDAWRVYWRVRPRFDPWWATARICAVVAGMFGGKEPPVERYLPKIEVRKAGKPRRKRAKPGPSARDFDRMLGI